MEWVKITDEQPPTNVWLEFFDGDKTMGHHQPFNHIDKINKRGEAQVNYIHNYTHWRLLTAPKLITCPECKSKDVDMTWVTPTSLPEYQCGHCNDCNETWNECSRDT